MIFVVSLGIPAKKALPGKVVCSGITTIIKNMPLDPEVTTMDVVILTTQDIKGPKQVELNKAIATKHPGVCVIYIYTKEADKDRIDTPNKVQCKRIKDSVIANAVDQFVSQHLIETGATRVTSQDFIDPGVEGEGVIEAKDKKKVAMQSDISFDESSLQTDEVYDMKDAQTSSKKKKGLFGFGKKDKKSIQNRAAMLKGKNAKKPAPVGGPTPMTEGSFDGAPTESDDGYVHVPDTAGGEPNAPESVFDEEVMNKVTPKITPKGFDDIREEIPVESSEEINVDEIPEVTVDSQELPPVNATLEPEDPWGETTKETMFPMEETPKEQLPAEDINIPVEKPAVDYEQNLEKFLSGIQNYENWEIFKENLNKDVITKHLIEENVEYVGLVNMLDVLDKQIEAIWRDESLRAEEKFDRIKTIGLEKSVRQATVNSINVSKAISVISTITMAASRTVEDKIKSIDLSLYKITTDKKAIMDTSKIDKAIVERANIQLELMNIVRLIIDLYKSMDLLVTDEINSLDEKLPSSNEFINTQVRPIGSKIFTPTNVAELSTKLCSALQQNRLTMSQLEDKINNLIDIMFKLYEQDEEIIEYQSNMINILKAHRVEDIVIVDSLIKKCLKIFIGPNDSGVHSTAITWCGILSHRQNTLLIDLSGRPKFKEYGIIPMNLEDFMNERKETNFLCVEADHKLNSEEVQALVTELKSRLNYYTYINIILDNDDAETLDQLSKDALTIHYVTNCTSMSIEGLKKTVKYETVKNIAKKLIMIDCPVNPLMITDELDVDPSIVQIITLPNIPQIKSCSFSHNRPYEYTDVFAIYEEAFR